MSEDKPNTKKQETVNTIIHNTARYVFWCFVITVHSVHYFSGKVYSCPAGMPRIIQYVRYVCCCVCLLLMLDMYSRKGVIHSPVMEHGTCHRLVRNY